MDPFPPCFLTPQHVAEVAEEAVREGRGGLDLEFNPETGKPHIIGVASSSRAAACWFEDELATTFVRDMQHAGGQLVGHAVMDADKPIIDGWLGITTPVSLWDDSLLRGYLCNSDWCSMPGKDEDAADKGSLGFMGLYAMASYYLGLPNWKRCISGETRVRLADGAERKISQLVQEQYAGEVQCVVNGYLTTRRVTDWHKSARSGRRMLQVS
ncbi:MAG: hypothetical protein LLG20_14890, partial [Acidobacteriales bacterium]|nr:hypothetical protein [Terriglobales bacterium]